MLSIISKLLKSCLIRGLRLDRSDFSQIDVGTIKVVTFVVVKMEGKSLEEELKMSGFSSPYQKVLLNLMFTSACWEARIQDILKEFRLTEQQYNVLRILKGQRGEPMNLYMIHERMLHRMSNATRIVEKLRQKGLAERILCESDRRQVEVSITKEGEELLERISPSMEALRGRIEENLEEDEVEHLHLLLEKMRG